MRTFRGSRPPWSLDPYRSLPQTPHPVTPSRTRSWILVGFSLAIGGLGAWVVPATGPKHDIVVAFLGTSIAVTLGVVALYRYFRRVLKCG